MLTHLGIVCQILKIYCTVFKLILLDKKTEGRSQMVLDSGLYLVFTEDSMKNFQKSHS